jgi:O-antigen/teichoic acid export membrane protein
MAAPSDRPAGPDAGPTGLPWRRLSSFVGLPLISLAGSLTVIPVISSVSGAQGWAAVALGQALGTGLATVLQYGWGFVGPTEVVGLDARGRARLLWVSTLSRLLVGAVLFPAMALVGALLAPSGYGLLTALTVVAMGTWGMSAYWFFIGTGRPGHAARYETVPRLVVQLAAALAALLTGDPIWYPIVFLAGQVTTIGWLTVRLSEISFERTVWVEAVRALRDQRAAAATDSVVAVLTSVPTSILAAVAPGSLAVFAAGDRVQRLAQSGIQPLYNAFQGWVSEPPEGRDVARRMRLAVAATGSAGVLAGVVVAVGLPVVDRWLFAGEVAVSHSVSVFFGAALALWSLSSAITFDVLAPAGRTDVIFRSTVACGLVAVAGVALLPQLSGAAGGAAAVLLGQLAALAVQAAPCRRVLGRHVAVPADPGTVAPAIVAG